MPFRPLRDGWSSGLALALALACDGPGAGASAGVDATTGDGPCGRTPDEVVVMDACALPSPCPAAWLYGHLEDCPGPLEEGASEYSSDERCVLDHLASGEPGRLALAAACDGRLAEALIHVRGPGDATLAIREVEPCVGACTCESLATWTPLEACALREPAHFKGCLATTGAAARLACMDLASWFTACAAAAPACMP